MRNLDSCVRCGVALHAALELWAPRWVWPTYAFPPLLHCSLPPSFLPLPPSLYPSQSCFFHYSLTPCSTLPLSHALSPCAFPPSPSSNSSKHYVKNIFDVPWFIVITAASDHLFPYGVQNGDTSFTATDLAEATLAGNVDYNDGFIGPILVLPTVTFFEYETFRIHVSFTLQPLQPFLLHLKNLSKTKCT